MQPFTKLREEEISCNGETLFFSRIRSVGTLLQGDVGLRFGSENARMPHTQCLLAQIAPLDIPPVFLLARRRVVRFVRIPRRVRRNVSMVVVVASLDNTPKGIRMAN